MEIGGDFRRSISPESGHGGSIPDDLMAPSAAHRYADVVVSHHGVRLYAIEAKLGMSRYYPKQQANDALIWLGHGLPTFMKRSGSVPEINWGAMIQRAY